ncbi:hypothetical protein HYW20_06375 [Candidatus Woesearchaeota archaeon]|nr:hypothetical protein [Candidatus Woesearchaeota archaeon]
MGKPSVSFFAMDFVLLFAVMGFIFAVFDLSGLMFVSELFLLLAFIFLLAFGMYMAYNNKKSGWALLSLTLLFLLLDASFILLTAGKFGAALLATILFSIAGFVISLLNMISHPDEVRIEKFEDEKGYYALADSIKSEEEPNIEKTFIPGKFIASRKSNKFHIAKCDWAKRVSKENQIWFDSKEDAEIKGFQADRCVV